MKVIINLSKRWLYTFMVIGILAIIGVGVYAVAGVSHDLDEVNLPSCSDGQVLGMSGSSWDCVAMPNIKIKVIEIGDWNMKAIALKYVAHGLTFSKIWSVSVIIRQDGDGYRYPLDWTQLSTGSDAGYWYMYTDNIGLIRQPGAGGFEDDLYDEIPQYNRGWITIIYTE